MRKYRLIFNLISVIFFTAVPFLFSQGTAGTKYKLESRSLVDMNTAGLIELGNFSAITEYMGHGVFIAKIDIGLFKRFNFGISYGASNFLGNGDLVFYDYPGVNVRYRIFDEEINFPAILLGFDSQGKGLYYKDVSRFEFKSPGFYLAVSKNFIFFGELTLHGNMNYSLETKDGNQKLNLMFGVEKTIGDNLSVISEYNLGLNDTYEYISKGRGYLNFGIRWSVAEGLTLGFDLKNIFANSYDGNGFDRAIKIEFVRKIF